MIRRLGFRPGRSTGGFGDGVLQGDMSRGSADDLESGLLKVTVRKEWSAAFGLWGVR